MRPKLIFIIGVGRSGTTLLQSMLHSHPSIHFTPETHFVKKYLSKAGKSRGKDAELIGKIRRDKDLVSISKKLNDHCDQVIHSDYSERGMADLFELILSENSENSEFIGDKDPMNVNYLKTIKREFPDARILHIIRDPRDVVLSRIKSEWGNDRGLAFHVAEYIHGIRKSRKEGRQLFGDNYLEIKYEELLSNAISVMTKVCDFLSLPFHEDMINYQNKADELLREREGSWKTNVTKPLQTTNTEKWKKEFTRAQISSLERSLGTTLQDLGYHRSTNDFTLNNLYFDFLVGMYFLALSLRHSK